MVEDQAERGQVLKLSEQGARKRYPHLVIASKPNEVVSARVLFDGSNGIPVNRRARTRDQERAPIAADLKRAMREKSKTGQKTFALSGDVSEAHRQVPIAECYWHPLGSQIQPASTVYVNKVGTFGVASASYKWSRARGGRLFLLEASGPCYRAALVIFFLLCSSLNVPLSWIKTAGGRHSHLGWVRAASPQQPTRDLGETGTVGDEVGPRSCRIDVFSDEQVRRGSRKDRICCRRAGI